MRDQIKKLIRDNQLNAGNYKQEVGSQKAGSKRSWSNVNNITSRKRKKHVAVSAFIDLCDINAYFQSVSTDLNYTAPESIKILEGTRNPLLSINTVKHHLLNQKRSSAGPDNLPYWFWKCFATQLAPIVTEIFNMSLRTSNVPLIWKSAILLPLPNESPLN